MPRLANESPAIRLEGNLLGPDILERLRQGDLPGQRPQDFGLPPRAPLLDEIAAAFEEARRYWAAFQHRLQRISEDQPATTETRQMWVTPLLALLGYELHFNRRDYYEQAGAYPVSHRAEESLEAPPVHIVGARQPLGRVPKSGRPRISPHALVQEFLNRSDHLWGLVTNGLVLRMLRKTTALRRQAYVEFDLQAIFEQNRFEDFALFYRLVHRTRLPRHIGDEDCWLEQYHRTAQEQGSRVRERLRYGVEDALRILGTALARDAYRRGMILNARDLYRQLLRLVYRFLFLLTAEERNLLGGTALYREHYSLSRFRRLVDNLHAYTDHVDLWLSLRVLWQILRDDAPKPQAGNRPLAALLGLPVLNGDLFRKLDLEDLEVTNRDLLRALRHLLYYYDEEARAERRVNYAALDVEELGSVYESLLDLQPVLHREGNRVRFDFVQGTERKSTGSYYTPHALVEELIRSALDPVLEARLEQARAWQALPWSEVASRVREAWGPDTLEMLQGWLRAWAGKRGLPLQTPEDWQEVWLAFGRANRARALDSAAVLSIKVLDPATGSGHFLLAAARRLGRALARVRTGEEEPSPEARREATREVIAHCIYGVDKNPMAVELCKVALWMESQTPDKPLTFLDHHIRTGDSLVGVLDLQVLEEGIPDAAFQPVSGDDKRLARTLKKRNKLERTGQLTLFAGGGRVEEQLTALARAARRVNRLPDGSPEELREKERRFRELQRQAETLRTACHLWTAAFFQPRNDRTPPEAFITTDALRRWLAGQPLPGPIVAQAQALAGQHRFFHWPVEFPEIFARGGFDVVLGNPPWERIKLQEKEFFATRAPEIARAANAAARKRLIRQLPQKNPALWEAYQNALHAAESTSRFLRASGFYPLTGRGDINTYSVFAERMRRLLRPGGRAGILVPTGIATDDTNKHFFAALVETGALVSLFDFENRERLFPAIAPPQKFCLLTLRRPVRAYGGTPAHGKAPAPKFAFFCTRAEHLRDPRRLFTLTAEDIARINPNTRTLPVFRTRQDAELTKAIYRRVPVLVNEVTGENPWGVRFLRMFDMSNDSHLFRTREQLEAAGYRLVGNRFVKEEDVWLPLYEAKLFHQFDHRHNTFEGTTLQQRAKVKAFAPPMDIFAHQQAHRLPMPRYWILQKEVIVRGLRQRWFVAFRGIVNVNTNRRSSIFTILPFSGAGNSDPIVMLREGAVLAAIFVADVNGIPFDWVTRQKLGGSNFNFFIMKQLPVLPPTAYREEDLRFIVPRVLELVYTAWDIKPFADDVWRDVGAHGRAPIRDALRAQWEANAAETGGHPWDPPDWLAAYPEIETDPARGIPFPPFKWDENRRARIRAELDAYYARLYGLTRKQLRYILDPADLTPRELEDILDPWEAVDDPLDPEGYAARVRASDFPGETFRVLKEKEMRLYGEYRTRRLVLEAWEDLEAIVIV